jgi:tRNA (cytidine/uridine-2'-O-)-methyltransferase
MLHIALYQPEIAPNTGNIIRLAANTGATLHLIHPLGFNPNDKQLRRAGLDYHDWTNLHHHQNYNDFLKHTKQQRILAISTKGTTNYHDTKFQQNDVLLFGPETRGLPKSILNTMPGDNILRIPMQPNNRSLNLANAVSIVTYEAWRQQSFAGSSS